MRKQRFGKPRDPIADAEYAAEFKIINEDARQKMEMFDKLPPVVRQAMCNEPSGAISIADVLAHVGRISDNTLARAVTENGKMAYQQIIKQMEAEENARSRQRAARLAQYDTPVARSHAKTATGTKKPRISGAK